MPFFGKKALKRHKNPLITIFNNHFRWLIIIQRWLIFTQRWLIITQRWLNFTQRWLILTQRWLIITQRWLNFTQCWLIITQRWLNFTQRGTISFSKVGYLLSIKADSFTLVSWFSPLLTL
jgi:hypothetical protein